MCFAQSKYSIKLRKNCRHADSCLGAYHRFPDIQKVNKKEVIQNSYLYFVTFAEEMSY